jgi:hypothetical protein
MEVDAPPPLESRLNSAVLQRWALPHAREASCNIPGLEVTK